MINSKIKVERSIATNKELVVGSIIQAKDLHMLSPGDGYKWSQINEVIGKKVKKTIPKNEIIYPDNLVE